LYKELKEKVREKLEVQFEEEKAKIDKVYHNKLNKELEKFSIKRQHELLKIHEEHDLKLKVTLLNK
jgi:hypothetical protein